MDINKNTITTEMTLQEAVRSLQKNAETLDRMRAVFKNQEAEALVNNQIRALDIAIDCFKKQISKKPIKTDVQEIRYTDSYRCPSCGGNFTGTGIADYCYHCGQKLDWGDEDEND